MIRTVLDQNFALNATRRGIEASEQELRAARANYLPDLSVLGLLAHVDPELAALTNGQSPEYQADGSLALTQLLYSPDANQAIGVQSDLLEADRRELEDAQPEIRVDTMLDLSSSKGVMDDGSVRSTRMRRAC